ncbi:hypothetical protein GW17_00002136 [Ensete ventricosum]|nr:hypothetical protein GW17_00002136 [Ensete ventricosum]
MVGPVPVDGHQAQVPEMCTGKVTFATSPVLRRGLSREYIHSASGVGYVHARKVRARGAALLPWLLRTESSSSVPLFCTCVTSR